MMWNVSQQDSLSICSAYRTEGAYCDVMPPALVDQVALYVKSLQPVPRPVAQGADEDNSIEADFRPRPVIASVAKKRHLTAKKRRVHKTFR
jgi:hypothetical protein